MIMNNDQNDKDTSSNVQKKQRKRSVFDLQQIRHLEQVFEQITHYPDLSLRQHLTQSTQLPDKKIQIWFQNRRAKWRKQHQLGHFGGLHDMTVDGRYNFVPAPKSNVILPSPCDLSIQSMLPNPSIEQSFGQIFYMALQRALAKSNEDFLLKRFESTNGYRPFNSSISCLNTEH